MLTKSRSPAPKGLAKTGLPGVEGIGFEHLPSCFATFFHRENGEIRPKERSQNLIVTLKKVTWNTSNGPKAGTHTCVYELWMGTFTYPEADAFA